MRWARSGGTSVARRRRSSVAAAATPGGRFEEALLRERREAPRELRQRRRDLGATWDVRVSAATEKKCARTLGAHTPLCDLRHADVPAVLVAEISAAWRRNARGQAAYR